MILADGNAIATIWVAAIGGAAAIAAAVIGVFGKRSNSRDHGQVIEAVDRLVGEVRSTRAEVGALRDQFIEHLQGHEHDA